MTIVYIILGIIVFLVIGIIAVYNSLVTTNIKADNAWSQIDVQLQRRFDLIPNFIETVKGYMNHEKEVLEKVTALRSSFGKATGVSEKAKLDEELSKAVNSILVTAENYPDLKASTNFSELSEELRNTENKIAFSRQFYNDAATAYNVKLALFPSNIIANMFRFVKRELFVTENEEARKNVKVEF